MGTILKDIEIILFPFMIFSALLQFLKLFCLIEKKKSCSLCFEYDGLYWNLKRIAAKLFVFFLVNVFFFPAYNAWDLK